MMAIFACLPTLMVGKKKKLVGKKSKLSRNTVISLNQESPNAADGIMKQSSEVDLGMKLIGLICHATEDGLKESHFTGSQSFSSPEKRSFITQKQLSNGSLARTDSGGEAAFEGSDEHDETCSMKRIHSDLGLQAKGEVKTYGSNINNKRCGLEKFEIDEQANPETMAASGHLSDPGIQRTAFWGSPLLKRWFLNIDTKHSNRSIKPLKRSFSCSSGNDDHGSPLSIMASYSADHVMLKRRSSSQILPSKSGKIWWKLFLRSHRNLHNPKAPQRLASILFSPNQNDCESSATHEPMEKSDNKKKTPIDSANQWVAFSLGSSLMDRVTAWISSLDDSEFCPIDDDDHGDKEAEGVADFYYPDVGESSAKKHYHKSFPTGDEVVQANSIVQSLNSFSSLAHMSGIGLKIFPSITAFVNLRSVNLSGNMIAHITPGSLPKGLHTLDLSRNKLSNIEGLRDLTRLRVLNLSYNQISKTGHGLSSCTLIKDLYLAGNKISYVEGLHRLRKLAVLDLSFNKITTATALGQLVANYNSLLAVNLLGNPIRSNVGDEHLKKTLLSLLPHLTYLNKKPLKPQRVKEVASDSVAKAALGGDVSTRRKSMKRSNYSSGSLMHSRVGEGSSRSRKHRSRSKQQ